MLVASPLPARGDGEPYVYTFDGSPAKPTSAYSMSDVDVQVHTRAMQDNPDSVESMQAQHGASCEAPPATHPNSAPEMTVYQCKDHLMTALKADDYGVVYLTPNRMLDWSAGETVFRFDVSTEDASVRDWWDIWLTPWEDNLALPLERDFPDLNGEPRNAIHFGGEGPKCMEIYQNNELIFGEDFYTSGCIWWHDVDDFLTPSSTLRSTFEIRISKMHASLCLIGFDHCWIDHDIPTLDFTRAVIQVGHHSYTPRKDGAGFENTWHWDNFSFGNSVEFSMIRANERYATGGGVFTFPSPAPPRSFLRFSAIGTVNIDGQQVSPQVPTYAPEHANSYFVPLPPGATTVRYDGGPDGWWSGVPMMKDVAIWSLDAPGAPAADVSGSPVSGVTVVGVVRMQGVVDHEGISVRMQPGQFLATTDSFGNFSLVDVPIGHYTMFAESPAFIGRTMDVVVDDAGSPIRLTATELRGGDVNRDRVVSLADLAVIVVDLVWGDATGRSDVDRSGRVDGTDLQIALRNLYLREWTTW